MRRTTLLLRLWGPNLGDLPDGCACLSIYLCIEYTTIYSYIYLATVPPGVCLYTSGVPRVCMYVPRMYICPMWVHNPEGGRFYSIYDSDHTPRRAFYTFCLLHIYTYSYTCGVYLGLPRARFSPRPKRGCDANLRVRCTPASRPPLLFFVTRGK